MKIRNLLAILLLLLGVLGPLGAQFQPTLDVAIAQSINPVLIIDAVDETILVANNEAQRLLSDGMSLSGRSIRTFLRIDDQPIPHLNASVLYLGKRAGHQFIIVQSHTTGGQKYYTILLQDWNLQHRSQLRNTILIGILYGLLSVLLLLAIFLLIRQRRLTSALETQQRKHASLADLLQRFLDSDRRVACVKDSKDRLILVNASFERTLAVDRTQVIGKRIEEIQSSTISHLIEEIDLTELSSNGPLEKHIHYKGRIFNVIQFPLTLPSSERGVGILASDITDEIALNQGLQANLNRWAQLTEMLSSTYTTHLTHFNQGLELACELTGSAAGLVLLNNAEEQVFHLVASCSVSLPQTELSRKISARYYDLVATGQTLIQNEGPITSPLRGVLGGSLTSLLTAPFYVDDELVGIVLLSQSAEGYTEGDGYQMQLLFSALYTAMLKAEREQALQESQHSLRLILDSTAEGIFGIDRSGRCTFCNAACLRLLGYDDESELLGKEIHTLIHHTAANGEAIPPSQCAICNTIRLDEGRSMEDEIFWRKDGTFFDVLCYSYPQKQDGLTIGAVVTFMDNTERKETLERIEYLSLHDQLTGLYNRAHFEAALTTIDAEHCHPYSVIVGDVNGLKLVNDVFGHHAGDTLLREVAKILQLLTPAHATVSRIGGDEFVILLPDTDSDGVKQIIASIQTAMDESEIMTGHQAIALGYATKHSAEQRIAETFEQAEDRMYRRKTLRLRERQRTHLETLTKNLFAKAPGEEHHAHQVRKHSLMIGKILNLDRETLSLLGRAAYYHDIGKVVLSEELLALKERDSASQEAYEEHVSAGYRILNTFEETVDLAEYVLHHHEWYNGSGYLKGLSGVEISYISRIIRIAEIWERESLEERERDYLIETLGRISGVEADPQMIEAIIATL